MPEDNALAFGGENDLVLAGHIAAPQGCEAYVARPAGPRMTVSHCLFNISQLNATASRKCASTPQRRTGWCIDLVPVMHFQNFNIVFVVKNLSRLFSERSQ